MQQTTVDFSKVGPATRANIKDLRDIFSDPDADEALQDEVFGKEDAQELRRMFADYEPWDWKTITLCCFIAVPFIALIVLVLISGL